MAKAFLSHSSFDKDFVEQVYAELGAAKAVYDAKTFKKNGDLTEQIRSGIEDCDTYALFLSGSAIKSRWVNAEIDLALELRMKWQVRKFLIFQLDDTKWDELPQWMGRYVVSCPPSPRQVALRLLNELQHPEAPTAKCHGRGDEERQLVESLSSSPTPPGYIYASGPRGIGRRTLLSKVYSSYYPHVSEHKIDIPVDQVDGPVDIYRRALAFSANWRASDYRRELERYISLTPGMQAQELAALLRSISIDFNQVVVINLGTSALTEEGRPQAWFTNLTKHLGGDDYPYVWFISQRFLHGSDLVNGIFYHVEPLNESWSNFLFRVLIKKYSISIPSKDEQRLIETSISGHPGLISMVAGYLRQNPRYKPNRTHNNIVKLVNEQVQQILMDLVGEDSEREKAVALFSECNVLSYSDILAIAQEWPEFESAVESLIDAGLLTSSDADYSLVSYVARAAEYLANKHRTDLAPIRKRILESFDNVEEGSFVSIKLLDARIVAHILEGTPIESYLSNLVMPSQQLKAARRKYDAQDYASSLRLAKEAYGQSTKLSDNGRREAWRLIGLSSARAGYDDEFQTFSKEYPKIKKSSQTDAIFNFGNGLRERLKGNLRSALGWYQKIDLDRYADSHAYRELAYVYCFERNFEKAYICVTKAHNLAFGNPYVLDILAMVLLDRFKTERHGVSIADIDTCLDQLRDADQREGTNFFFARSKMRDVIVNNDLNSLSELFSIRRTLPIVAKVALLSMLSLKGKDLQYNELRDELRKAMREKRNPLADIELARIDVEHHCARGQFSEAAVILRAKKMHFTARCCEELERQIPNSLRDQ